MQSDLVSCHKILIGESTLESGASYPSLDFADDGFCKGIQNFLDAGGFLGCSWLTSLWCNKQHLKSQCSMWSFLRC